jgi:STE24 endopeptidase
MRTGSGLRAALLLLVLACFSGTAMAQPAAAPTARVQVQSLPSPVQHAKAQPAPAFNAQKAVNAYLATVSGAARQRSNAYFEGGYVLLVVDTVYAIAVMALLLWLGISARMRNLAQRWTNSRFWQVPIYALMFLAITAAATFPLTVYEDFIREHAYGLSNMTFLQWLGDFAKDFAIQLVFGTILITLIYAAIRATGRFWWLWGWAIVMVFLVIGIAVSPVFIEPMFNHYEPLKPGPVKAEILSLARSNGIPVTNVYEFNASRQSTRISANVAGLFGTTRIAMTDNLLKRCSPREIYAVLGHEMGHYVLDHVVIGLTWLGLLLLAGFGFVAWGYRRLTDRFGSRWGVQALADPAGLPVAVALITFFMFVATPVLNTINRTIERQADIFGLNTARQPDGFATVTLKLAEYRKLDPSPFEEFVFYDHPSGRSRITMAMRWKAEHLNDADLKAGPASPQ